MGAFVVTTTLIAVWLISVYNLNAEAYCSNYSGTNCSTCINKGDDCYWCPATVECLEWNWGSLKCKGNGYFYGQCDMNGVGFIIVFSFAIFLLLFILICCCICCCCCYLKRRKRREYVQLTTPLIIRNERNGRSDMRHRQFHARPDEIRRKYGLEANANDSTV